LKDPRREQAGGTPLGANPLLRKPLHDGTAACVHAADAETVHRVYSNAAPRLLPQALAMVPRLGIGTRMSLMVWPGIWQALREGSFSANAIQNSQRELNLLADLLGRKEARKVYYPGVGFVPEGHTGSTFEGLWLCGVAEALKAGATRPYGADADHIVVRKDDPGLETAKRVITAARFYSFFTIDVSGILDYSSTGPAGLARKYTPALEALEELAGFIRSMRGAEPFDLELSVDEHPPQVHPFDCLTGEAEAAFILAEARRRGIPLTHLAPNLGVEKHVDYRHPAGLEGLEARVRALQTLAEEAGVLLDCHSGDDLSSPTRRALKRATGGKLHFKISPCLQGLFGEVMAECDRKRFALWWEDSLEFAKENARKGSALAQECVRESESGPGAQPDPRSRLFRLYSYATVGKRDQEGNFIYREMFYTLPPAFGAEYTRRVALTLAEFAADLFSY
jgi:hypothetical protein